MIKIPETLKEGNPIYCHQDYTFKANGKKLLTFKKGKWYTIKAVVPDGDEFIVIYFNDKFRYMFSLNENSKFNTVFNNYYEDYFYDLQKSREMKLIEFQK